MKKKLLSIVLALALCLSLLPATALAEGNITEPGTCTIDAGKTQQIYGIIYTAGASGATVVTVGTGEDAFLVVTAGSITCSPSSGNSVTVGYPKTTTTEGGYEKGVTFTNDTTSGNASTPITLALNADGSAQITLNNAQDAVSIGNVKYTRMGNNALTLQYSPSAGVTVNSTAGVLSVSTSRTSATNILNGYDKGSNTAQAIFTFNSDRSATLTDGGIKLGTGGSVTACGFQITGGSATEVTVSNSIATVACTDGTTIGDSLRCNAGATVSLSESSGITLTSGTVTALKAVDLTVGGKKLTLDGSAEVSYADSSLTLNGGKATLTDISEMETTINTLTIGSGATFDLSGATVPETGWKVNNTGSSAAAIGENGTLILPTGYKVWMDGAAVETLTAGSTGAILSASHTHTYDTTTGTCVCGAVRTYAIELVSEESTLNWSDTYGSVENSGVIVVKNTGNAPVVLELTLPEIEGITWSHSTMTSGTVASGETYTFNLKPATDTNGKYPNAGEYDGSWTVKACEPNAETAAKATISGLSLTYTVEKVYLDVKATSYLRQVGSEVPDLTADGAYTITGFAGNETANSVGLGTPKLSYDSVPNMTKAGSYIINVDIKGVLGADSNYAFNYPSAGELRVVDCVHEFTDLTLGTTTTQNDSIFATCSKKCKDYIDENGKSIKKAIITIIAPDNPVYEAGLEHNASLLCDDQIELDADDISYSSTPINAGNYTASIVYEFLRASVSYTVAPRPLTIKADDKSVYVGGSAPEYTYTVTGWGENYDAEDEFAPVLTGVTADCGTADLTKTGTYAITLSGDPIVKDSEGNDVTRNYTFTTESGTLTVSTRPSSSGSSTSVNIPISGDDNTIHVGASVKGDKATVDEVDLSQLNTVIGDDVQTGTVTIDFSGLKSSKEITTVEIPADVVKQIAQAVNDPTNDAESLEIVFSDGTSIEFDAAALGEKAAQADGVDITISIKHHKNAELTNAQKDAVGSRTAYDINVTSGGKHISDMGGKITVYAPYELKSGEKVRGIVVYYIDENGNRERCETSYDGVKQRVSWKTDHLSLYMIDYDEALANNPFTDVTEDGYYYEAILWAADNGITSGTGDGTTFSPNMTCTRAQAVTFLWRAAGSPTPKSTLMSFADVSDGAYYYDAVLWAVENGITNGTGDGTTFSPNAECTRAQIVTFLWRAQGSEKVTTDNPFTDITDGAYYAGAVLWAAENGITTGTGDGTTFSPDDECTRAQIVTFLYRYLGNQ